MAKKDKESLLNRIKAGTRVHGVDGWICFPDKSQLKTFFLSVPFPVVYQWRGTKKSHSLPLDSWVIWLRRGMEWVLQKQLLPKHLVRWEWFSHCRATRKHRNIPRSRSSRTFFGLTPTQPYPQSAILGKESFARVTSIFRKASRKKPKKERNSITIKRANFLRYG